MSATTTRVKDPDDGGACDCGGQYWWRKYCGAYVCDRCEQHKNMARCFCGWREGQNRAWVNGKIIVTANNVRDPEQVPEKLEGEECDYFGDEPLDEEGFGYRD